MHCALRVVCIVPSCVLGGGWGAMDAAGQGLGLNDVTAWIVGTVLPVRRTALVGSMHAARRHPTPSNPSRHLSVGRIQCDDCLFRATLYNGSASPIRLHPELLVFVPAIYRGFMRRQCAVVYACVE